MDMYFGCDMCDTYSTDMPVHVVFKGWAITNSSTMAWSCVGVILLTMLYRLLSSLEIDYSNWILKKLQMTQASPMTDVMIDSGNKKTTNSTVAINGDIFFLKLSHSLLKTSIYALALFCMLVAMTYNYLLCGCLLIGFFLGEFLFGVNEAIRFKDGQFQVKFTSSYGLVQQIDCCN